MNSLQHNAVVIFVRSLIFQIAFYLNLTLHILASLPAFVLPHKIMVEVARSWGRTSVWLLSAICGVHLELRGHEKIPKGPLLVASKHQSAWDTFALLPMFPYPTYVLKRELTWIPFFGWCLLKAGQIPLDRDAGKEAIAKLMARVRAALAQGRQVIVFPEGTRRRSTRSPTTSSASCRSMSQPKFHACRWRSTADSSGRAANSCGRREPSLWNISTSFRPACHARRFFAGCRTISRPRPIACWPKPRTCRAIAPIEGSMAGQTRLADPA